VSEGPLDFGGPHPVPQSFLAMEEEGTHGPPRRLTHTSLGVVVFAPSGSQSGMQRLSVSNCPALDAASYGLQTAAGPVNFCNQGLHCRKQGTQSRNCSTGSPAVQAVELRMCAMIRPGEVWPLTAGLLA
jgi:hypothetical protein